jgi:hypothetical protein
VEDRTATVSNPEPLTSFRRAALPISVLAVLLAVAFFPLLFDHVAVYDDEGFWLVTIRQFIHHGSLYVHTLGSSYGPFYFSFTGLLYRITGQNPSLFNGRLLVLTFTALSAGFLAAAVWRVTRSLPFSILCEIATFGALILVAGNEPMSPGSIIALVLSVLVYVLASYSVHQRNTLLVIAGAAVGALTMIKVNIGIFAAVGLVVAFVVGNANFARWFRGLIGAGAVLLPFALMSQKLSDAGVATFAFVVAVSILGYCAVMTVDRISLQPRGLIAAILGFAAVFVVSTFWPLLSGTSPSALVTGVFIRPLQQVNILSILPVVRVQWLAILVTALVVVAVSTRLTEVNRILPPKSPIAYLVLSTAALVVLGLGIGFEVEGQFGAWLPAIILLPALALIADVPSSVRLALRFSVPLAILQVLHAYPVAGSQTGWATFLMFLPCAIALAAGMGGLQMWHGATSQVRGITAGALCVAVMLAAGLWPPGAWVTYSDLKPLNLPGARFVRVDLLQARELRQLTRVVKANCDTFYSVPGLDSLYIYSNLPTPTGQLANWAGAMTGSQEREVVSQLSHLQAMGKRVCIVRDLNTPYYAWNPGGSEANRPIGRFIRQYQRTIALFGPTAISLQAPRYSVSLRGQ